MAKHKSITINTLIYDKMHLSSSKVRYELEKYTKEKEQLQKFAAKITKVPETVRVYVDPNLVKEEDET